MVTDTLVYSSKGTLFFQGCRNGVTYRCTRLTNGRFTSQMRVSYGWHRTCVGRRWERIAKEIIAACEKDGLIHG